MAIPVEGPAQLAIIAKGLASDNRSFLETAFPMKLGNGTLSGYEASLTTPRVYSKWTDLFDPTSKSVQFAQSSALAQLSTQRPTGAADFPPSSTSRPDSASCETTKLQEPSGADGLRQAVRVKSAWASALHKAGGLTPAPVSLASAEPQLDQNQHAFVFTTGMSVKTFEDEASQAGHANKLLQSSIRSLNGSLPEDHDVGTNEIQPGEELALRVVRMDADWQTRKGPSNPEMGRMMHESQFLTKLTKSAHVDPSTISSVSAMLALIPQALSEDDKFDRKAALEALSELCTTWENMTASNSNGAGLQPASRSATTAKRGSGLRRAFFDQPPVKAAAETASGKVQSPEATASAPTAARSAAPLPKSQSHHKQSSSGLRRAFFDQPPVKTAAETASGKVQSSEATASAQTAARSAAPSAASQAHHKQSSIAEAPPHAAACKTTSIKPPRAKSSCSKLGAQAQQASQESLRSAHSRTFSRTGADTRSKAEAAPQPCTPIPQLPVATASCTETMDPTTLTSPRSSTAAQQGLKDAQPKQISSADIAALELQKATRRADEAAAALILQDERERETRLLREQVDRAQQEKTAAKKAKVQKRKAKSAQAARASSAFPLLDDDGVSSELLSVSVIHLML